MAKKSAAEKYKALVDLEFTGVEQAVKNLEPQLQKLGNAVPKELSKGFADVLPQVEILKKKLAEATDEETVKDLEVAMGRVATEAQKVGQALGKTLGKRGSRFIVPTAQVEREVNALGKLRDRMKQVNVAGQRTTLMSQNMLRVIQDSPFGMLGMANNIQMLAENLSHARANGESFTEAMGRGLKNLLMGPMAFAAVVAVSTIIIQKWDEIVEMGHRFMDVLDGLSEAQRDLNQAVREFDADDTFTKWVEGLSDEDMVSGLKASSGHVTRIKEEFEEMGKGMDGKDLEAILKVMTGTMPGLDSAARIQLLDQFAEDSDNMTKIEVENAIKKYKELEKLEGRHAEFVKANVVRGLEVERDAFYDIEEEKKKKKLSDEDKEKIKQIKLLEQRDEMMRDMEMDRIEWERDQKEKARKEEEKAEKEAERKRRQEQLDASREMRQRLANVKTGVRAEDVEAQGAMAGVVPRVISTSTRAERIEAVRMEAFVEQFRLSLLIDARRKGVKEVEFLMKDARGEDLESLKEYKRLLLAEEEKYNAQYTEITLTTEQKIRQEKEKNRQEDLQSMANIASQMGTVFGNMATIMASEGEKGLKQHKGMLKAAAIAEAVAASISVFRGVVWANPLSVAGAFAASAAVLTSLMAKIRQIDNPNAGAGGEGTISGGFVALNNNITASRAADFQQDQSRLNKTTAGKAANDAAALVEGVNKLASNIQDQKVVLEKSTAGEVIREGGKFNTRRVQTTG